MYRYTSHILISDEKINITYQLIWKIWNKEVNLYLPLSVMDFPLESKELLFVSRCLLHWFHVPEGSKHGYLKKNNSQGPSQPHWIKISRKDLGICFAWIEVRLNHKCLLGHTCHQRNLKAPTLELRSQLAWCRVGNNVAKETVETMERVANTTLNNNI